MTSKLVFNLEKNFILSSNIKYDLKLLNLFVEKISTF